MKLASCEASKPNINDYYTPSKEMEGYQALTMAAVGLGSGLAVHKVYKMVKGKQ